VSDRPTGIYLCDVEPEPVAWLWPGRIPLGKLTILDGNPGDGKTTMALDILARVTQGAFMPDQTSCQQGGIVILTAEDGLGDTIRPRLEAAGADLSRALAIPYIPDGEEGERPPVLPQDLPAIEEAIRRVNAAAVLIDPLVAFLAGRIDTNKDADVRRALSPLATLANRLNVAFIGIRHLNKMQGGHVLYRGGGSIGIIGAARAGLLVARDPDDESMRVLAMTKSNLGPDPGSLSFALEGTDGVARIRWLGASRHSAQDLLAIPSDSDDRSAVAEATAFLRQLLGAGPVPAQEVQKQARAAGIPARTLTRAKKAAHVASRRSAGRSGWEWEPPADFQPSQGGQEGQRGQDWEVGHLDATEEENGSFRSDGAEILQGCHGGDLGRVGNLGYLDEVPEDLDQAIDPSPVLEVEVTDAA
jgi:hypothetical protein